jgi:hypothetical protein
MIGVRKRHIATRDQTRRTTCRICNHEADKTYFLHREVVRLTFLPLFAIRSAVYTTCSHCRTLRELKSGATIKLDREDEAIKAEMLSKYNKAFDFRDVWGSVLIILSIGALAYMVVTHS